MKLQLTESENKIIYRALRDYVKSNQGKIPQKKLQPYVQVWGCIKNENMFYADESLAAKICQRLLLYSKGAESESEAKETLQLVYKLMDVFGVDLGRFDSD